MVGQEISGPDIPNEGLYICREPWESSEDGSVECAVTLDGEM